MNNSTVHQVLILVGAKQKISDNKHRYECHKKKFGKNKIIRLYILSIFDPCGIPAALIQSDAINCCSLLTKINQCLG